MPLSSPAASRTAFFLGSQPTRLQVGDTLVLRRGHATPTFYRGACVLRTQGTVPTMRIINAAGGPIPAQEEARMMRHLAWSLLDAAGLSSPLRMIRSEQKGDEHRFTILPTPEGAKRFYYAHQTAYAPDAAFEREVSRDEGHLRSYLRQAFYGPMTATLIFFPEILADPFAAYPEGDTPQFHSSQIARATKIATWMDRPKIRKARQRYERLEEDLTLVLFSAPTVH